jgi:hypothetical protein
MINCPRNFWRVLLSPKKREEVKRKERSVSLRNNLFLYIKDGERW